MIRVADVVTMTCHTIRSYVNLACVTIFLTTNLKCTVVVAVLFINNCSYVHLNDQLFCFPEIHIGFIRGDAISLEGNVTLHVGNFNESLILASDLLFNVTLKYHSNHSKWTSV